jgi:YidC/Oxa1 family membrane protein insertase
MDNRRFVSFIILSFGFLFLWTTFASPLLFPVPEKPPQQAADQNQPADAADTDATATDATEDGSASTPDNTANAEAEGSDTATAAAASTDTDAVEPPIHPAQTVVLGSLDPESGYFLSVELTSAGAAVESVSLTDPKFRDLIDKQQQVQVIGNNSSSYRTFALAMESVDQQLSDFDMSLQAAHWEVVSSTESDANFAFNSPDGKLRLEKHYRIVRFDGDRQKIPEAFRNNAAGYTIQVEVAVINLSDTETTVSYELQGPVGIILENAEHTRKYRDVKIEFLGDDSDVTMSASDIQELYSDYRENAAEEGHALTNDEILPLLRENDQWTGSFRYAGLDVQFFAALVAPIDERTELERNAEKLLDRTYPMLVQEDRTNPARSDVSFRMVSTPVVLTPAGSPQNFITHSFGFFVGPKRGELLDAEPFQAERVLDYGSYFGFIARLMHTVLSALHNIGMPYFLAIICLTGMVRGCLFPLSRKQAIMAAKQKALQPKVNELKAKYGEDREKLARAQMELWRKYNINPLSGCLPLFLQLPVFIGLYTSLNTAVDLRLSTFLWIDNLAAPDSLFRMPFSLPFLGQDFNLLPCITVVLFLTQQKMFMPPPADEQQEAQQKMMNFMTLFFGVMFWHVPAGLCIYFIASSLWGLAERTFLGKASTNLDTASVTVVEPDSGTTDSKSGRKSKPASDQAQQKPGFFQRLMQAAEEAQRQAEKTKQESERRKNKKK